AGSYLLRIRAPGMHEVSYPVFIRRLEHWTGIPPGGTEPLPIVLPRLGELGPDEVYVPSGWFWSGGDPLASNSLPLARFWLEGFVIRRFPVTIEDYLEFLNDLVAQGREEDVLQRLPPLLSWEEARGQEDLREQRFVRDEQGRILLARGELRWPVTLVNWYDACAYAEWRSWREGLPWRLPSELEHEKAARGVDRRVFPWGRFLDPSFCHMRDSHSGTGRALKAVVDAYPVDESPYGARGMAGNAHEWCLDAYQAEGPESIEGRPVVSHGEGIQGPGAGGAHRVYRGGSWRAPESLCRVAYRDAPPAIYRNPTVSFRLARSLR
ncbi:formylglycine-generating enzyme family protein, partial [Archangium sp.]|uniref:formylglycine-generating enzyme family protein n=1 Tax=Archangium sp. TaxID=1872627 RepID=UPI002D250F88